MRSTPWSGIALSAGVILLLGCGEPRGIEEEPTPGAYEQEPTWTEPQEPMGAEPQAEEPGAYGEPRMEDPGGYGEPPEPADPGQEEPMTYETYETYEQPEPEGQG